MDFVSCKSSDLLYHARHESGGLARVSNSAAAATSVKFLRL